MGNSEIKVNLKNIDIGLNIGLKERKDGKKSIIIVFEKIDKHEIHQIDDQEKIINYKSKLILKIGIRIGKEVVLVDKENGLLKIVQGDIYLMFCKEVIIDQNNICNDKKLDQNVFVLDEDMVVQDVVVVNVV